MARMALSTRNLEGVKATLRQYGAGARERAQVVVQQSMERTYGTAQELCPVDTGFMKQAMRAELTPNGLGYQVGFEAGDFTGAGKDFYPVFTEFGTRFMPAQPCIFPAAEAERPRFREALREALRPRRPAATR